MKVLQWTMTVPPGKEEGFIAWFKERAVPVFEKYGAIKHELYREVERNKYVERVFFVDCFDMKNFLNKVKINPNELGIINIEQRVLVKVC